MPLLIALNCGCLFAFIKENKSGYVITLGNLRSLLNQDSSPAPIFSQDQLKEVLPPGSPLCLEEGRCSA